MNDGLLHVTLLLDQGLTPDTPYFYTVVAVNDQVESDRPTPVSGRTSTEDLPPAKPKDFAVKQLPGGVKLTWTSNSEADLAGYVLYAATEDGNDPQPITFIRAGTTEYTDASDYAVPGTTYFLFAVDVEGNTSEDSAEAIVISATKPVIAGVTMTDTGTRTRSFSVTLADPSLAADTRFYWYTLDGPPDAPGIAFENNGTSAAATVTATFARAGTYRVGVVALHSSGQRDAFEYEGDVTLERRAQTLVVNPWRASVAIGGSLNLTAQAVDQFGQSYTPSGVSYAYGPSSESGGGVQGSTYTAGTALGSDGTSDDRIVATLDDAQATVQVTVVAAGVDTLSGWYYTLAGPEGLEFDGPVAVIEDSLASAPLSDYEATIAWGDEAVGAVLDSTANGKVTLSRNNDGNIVVMGKQTYADTGEYPLKVTFRHTSSGRTLVLDQGKATVSDAGIAVAGKAISGRVGTALTNVLVATLVDSNALSQSSDFRVMIDWGDGSPLDQGGSISKLPDGTYAIRGSHLYSAPYRGDLHVYISDPNDGTELAVTALAEVRALNNPVVNNVTMTNIDPSTRSFTATLQNPSLAADTRFYWYATGPQGAPPVAFENNGTMLASTSKAVFGQAGTYHVSVIAQHSSGETFEFDWTEDVTLDRRAQQLFVMPWRATVGAGGSLELTAKAVDQFGQSYTPSGVSYVYGLGSESGGGVQGSTYTAGTTLGSDGTSDDRVIATLDDAQATVQITVMQNVAGVLSGAYAVLAGPEGASFAGTVAAFQDNAENVQLSEYEATVALGDEAAGTVLDSTANGKVTLVRGDDGQILVQGLHTYGDTGKYGLIVTFRHVPTDRSLVLDQGNATVTDAAITPTPRAIAGALGVALTDVVVATFVDANPLSKATDFSATVDWGDGSAPSAATSIEKGPDGSFVIHGTHTYAGRYSGNVRVYLNDAHDKTALTITSTANIASGAATTPTRVRAERLNAQQIYLEWSKDEDFGVYTIWRQQLDANGQPVGPRKKMSAPGTMPFYDDKPDLFWTVDQNLPPGTRYRYTVQMTDSAGNISTESEPVYASTTEKPAKPTNLQATSQGRLVHLTWADPADQDIQGWQVYRATQSSGPYVLVHGETFVASTAEYDDSATENGKSYWYRIVAVSKVT